jgi:hypothetical protein
MIKPISHLNCTIGMLPSSYKESLTYEEQLMYFMKTLNETIDVVNNLSEIVDNIDVNFESINEQIATINLEIEKINDNFSDFSGQIYSTVQAQLNTFNAQILSLLNDYQTIFNASLQNLKDELEEEIHAIELGNVNAYDPTTGTYVNVSQAILNVYETLRNNAITASEFDALELTATAFDNIQITAYNFDVNGKTFLEVA